MSLPRITRWLVALALGGSMLVAAAASSAQEEPDPRSSQELRAAIGEASAEEAAVLAELADVRARRAQLEAEAARLDGLVAEAVARQAEAQREVDRIEAEQASLEREIARIQGEIDVARADFEESAATLYRNAGNGDVLSVLDYADDPRSAVAASRYLRQVSADAQEEADRQRVLKDDLDAAHEALEEQRRAADGARAAAAAEAAEVAELRAAQEPARAAAEAEEAQEQVLLGDIQARKDQWETQLAQLQAEQAALAAGVSRGGGGGGGGNGRFIWPCNGGVASGFGYRMHPVLGYQRMHTGVDMSCANGAPIVAAGDGVVTSAGWNGGYGNAVVIDHGDGLATLYGHQSSLAVSPGERVSTGQLIGYVGSTGLSTGPHLHWEVWVNGTPVNPLGYV